MENPNDVKELIPEFFYLPEFLVNMNGKKNVLAFSFDLLKYLILIKFLKCRHVYSMLNTTTEVNKIETNTKYEVGRTHKS